jgi:uncharacterized protein
MFLSIKEMEVRKVRFAETFEPGEIDFQGSEAEQAGPLRVEGVAELLPNTDGEVRIQGTLSVRMKAVCDRCLGEAILPIDTVLDLFYRPMSVIARSEEVEIDEGEAQIGFYEGEGMELEDILREQVMLLLPMQRVCNEDCKGICPLCGKNRNETACQCKVETVDDRWKALRDI